MAAKTKNAWADDSIIRELNLLSESKTSTPMVSTAKRKNSKRNNSSIVGICSPMVLRKIKPKNPTLVEEKETITLDDSDENISRMQKEDFERCNSIEIIHDTSENSGQDSVEVIEIPNMRPEQPKRKKKLKILPRGKKGVKKLTMQKAKDRRMAGKNRSQNIKMKKKVELEKPQVKNMFNPNVRPEIRFANVEIGLPFQFGRPNPKSKSTRTAPKEKLRLRPIVIDGQNVAVEHAKRTRNPFGFSSRGIKIAVDYFKAKGCEQIEVWLPRDRHQVGRCDNQMILNNLLDENILQFSPSRRVAGHYENAYDDRYVVQNAAAKEGIIVSNDQFRDLMDEEESFKDAIENRLLNFNFVTDKDGISDTFMVPHDPRGKNGPRLEQFLMF